MGEIDFRMSEGANERIQLDALLALVEEIADHFRGRRLDNYPAAVWARTENEPVYSIEHLDQLRQFRGGR
jgi:hypothetical protein